MLLLRLRKQIKSQIKYKMVYAVDGFGNKYRQKVPR